jgi:hypothetical protein
MRSFDSLSEREILSRRCPGRRRRTHLRRFRALVFATGILIGGS